MDNLGSEVGQKMRSAVKAKLLELGTGGSAGYIDDELPDYVMIMVANKRSKQQMISDLNLFLGSQTDLFVTWLHEVLQKLQEVTLPAVALQKKRKTNQKDEAALSKKDKKEKKKDKKTQKKPSEQECTEITSITDVFAGELLEKAKKTFEIDENAVQKDKKQENDSPTQKDETDDFNIPTISEMSSSSTQQRVVTSETREKDLAELADIQKKIFAAKKQLKILDDVDESEDEDFLNIKEDGEEFEESNELGREKKKQSKAKSPIVFDREQLEREASPIPAHVNEVRVVASSLDTHPIEKHLHSVNSSSSRMQVDHSHHHHKHDNMERQEHGAKDGNVKKKSIHERLGHIARDHKSDHSHQHRRAEKELYVPAFRRREMEKEKRSNGEIDSRSSRKRSSSTDKNKRDSSAERLPQQRIGSRVVVAPPKPDLIDDDVDSQRTDRPVNSVIKIKPRPSISPSKQACKNLLLRAVAEAQRSTILIKPKKDVSSTRKSSGGGGGGSQSSTRNTKFFTKSYRDRISRDALIRRTAKNFVIEVKADADRHHEDEDEEMDQYEDEEYVPEHISDRGESDLELIYIPQAINFTTNEEEDISREINDENTNQSKTQFVVTLNDKTSSNYKSKSKSSRLNGAEHSSSRSSESHKSSREKVVDIRSRLTLKKEQQKQQARNDRESNSSPSCSTPPRPSSAMSSSKKSELIKIYKRPKEVKKIVIKNDSEDDDFHSPKKESPNKATTTHIAKEEKINLPTIDDQKANASTAADTEEEGSMTPPLPAVHRKQHEEKQTEKTTPENNTPNKRKRQLIKFDLVNKQLKVEEPVVPAKRRSKSGERENVLYNEVETNVDDGHKISIRNLESKKYDNLPSSLNSVPIDSSLVIKSKPKERCKYFPTCTKNTCEFYHPAAPCKSFPNCKFAEKCLYVHPKCKFDLTCAKIGCNFQHSAPIGGQLSAPPLSSHVVPVQNYKSISSTAVSTSMCKFYPNCSKPGCPFFHPKMCKFGRNCINKMECNFYHHDSASSKFKWVASIV
ncbi:zinc finger CCCH domain-containing protein 14 [Episyrphus balteatus]|uniref:zinc finger CCCH domain-containing protein 14 n=1 Tax=Episyrphus balteatus TaxID=286459 RepID=UPI0024852750|nr:zinc finger CCCH domain-containing protein 14 [Episyrphus balteatus]